ncbi:MULTISPECIES: PASTA domain-containing protein [unclassified Pedobacter]|uniref:PASTA domain-containing protein n=1 Tax=unclassified Pedobacter TaxID=2628915 RepID=UPI000B4A76B3|nr:MULTISPECIES: PASTA domain-containing protein [unclassified Pedobacter]MCX2430206.1 PASTA domain-containing protein [Pedobacter sp. GR22-10]OWK70189.1 serine/threonine protein kinase [Pedobacter sp. AJM]
MSKFIAYLKTKSFRTNIIAALLTVVGLLLVAFFSLRYYTKHGQGLNVPLVKGLSFEQAVRKLEDAGLKYEVDSVFIMDQPAGIVIDQDPDPNTFVKDNRTIYLTINAGKIPNTKFPDIAFKTLREAQAVIESSRLKLGDTTYKPDVSRDVVLEATFGGQPIQPGDIVPVGSRINLVLGDGRGNEEVDIPQLTGLTVDEAKFSLKGSNLTLGNILYEGDITDSANAVIIKQDPMPVDSLTKVAIGTKINVTLSNKQP